ncbi:monooxygenase, partial [Erwinia amylovora]|nr:monooxygenase [Erwinia amylovora]
VILDNLLDFCIATFLLLSGVCIVALFHFIRKFYFSDAQFWAAVNTDTRGSFSAFLPFSTISL